MNEKPWYASKTIWTNLILGVAAAIPGPVSAFVLANPQVALSILAAVNLFLRKISHGAVTLS